MRNLVTLLMLLCTIQLYAQQDLEQNNDCWVDDFLGEEFLRVITEPRDVPDSMELEVRFINHYEINNQGDTIFALQRGVDTLAIKLLNNSYKTIKFKLESTIKGDTFLYQSDYLDYRWGNELKSFEKVGRIFNSHIVKDVRAGNSPVAGLAEYPYFGTLRNVIKNFYLLTSTYSHEIGHNGYLYHTHDNTQCDTLDGLKSGDFVDDTNVDDPNSTGFWCNLVDTLNDDCGFPILDPPNTNIMSLHSRICRDSITLGQEYRFRYWLTYYFPEPVPVGEIVYPKKIDYDFYRTPSYVYIRSQLYLNITVYDQLGRVIQRLGGNNLQIPTDNKINFYKIEYKGIINLEY